MVTASAGNRPGRRDSGGVLILTLILTVVLAFVALALAREQCLAIVSVVAINPRFSAASRARLQDPALERWIAGLVEQHLQ